MGYEKMSTALLPALEDFPEIENTEEVTRQINRFFAPYIFFERHKDSIELWCSCCLIRTSGDNVVHIHGNRIDSRECPGIGRPCSELAHERDKKTQGQDRRYREQVN